MYQMIKYWRAPRPMITEDEMEEEVCVCAGATYLLQRIQSSKKQNCSLPQMEQFVNYEQKMFKFIL